MVRVGGWQAVCLMHAALLVSATCRRALRLLLQPLRAPPSPSASPLRPTVLLQGGAVRLAAGSHVDGEQLASALPAFCSFCMAAWPVQGGWLRALSFPCALTSTAFPQTIDCRRPQGTPALTLYLREADGTEWALLGTGIGATALALAATLGVQWAHRRKLKRQ